MKNVIILAALILLLPAVGVGENNDVNVLNYYAVTNSIDGQPLIDRINVMRFLPVFAMRDYVDSVHITIFFGSKIYSRSAVSIEGGRYWEVMLPQFRLGEAIQRIEVEVSFELSPTHQAKIALANRIVRDAVEKSREDSIKLTLARQKLIVEEKAIETLDTKARQSTGKDTMKTWFANRIKESNQKLDELKIGPSEADGLRIVFSQADVSDYIAALQNFFLRKGMTSGDTTRLVDSLIQERSIFVRKYQEKYSETRARDAELQSQLRERQVFVDSVTGAIQKNKEDLGKSEARYFFVRDSLAREIAREIEVGLTDTMYVGPAVKKSDLIIDPEFKSARILYRNYKTVLRKMLALDPAERVGIFRVRYIPFAIVGIKDRPMSLWGQFSETPTTTFEVGLSFGDAITPGDEFVPTEFSLRRLGVAFAVTQKLFKDDADIMAIAVTYDFNSYASIGYGANFAHSAVRGYASLGINKKAFEQVVAALGKLFE